MSVLGNRVLRVEDPKFLTVGGTYIADLTDPLLDGAAYATYVRSTMAHATILGIDTSDAAEMPGVLGVFTADDLGLTDVPALAVHAAVRRPLLARETVRYVGEPIAVVADRTRGPGRGRGRGRDRRLRPAARRRRHRGGGHRTGRCCTPTSAPTSATTARSGASPRRLRRFLRRLRGRRPPAGLNQRVAAAPMEVRSAAAAWGPDGRLHQWVSTQHPQARARHARGSTSARARACRVVAPDVGGGFGAKIGNYPEEILLGDLARIAGRPVRWIETRTENMVGLGHGRAQLQDLEIGGTRDGRCGLPPRPCCRTPAPTRRSARSCRRA